MPLFALAPATDQRGPDRPTYKSRHGAPLPACVLPPTRNRPHWVRHSFDRLGKSSLPPLVATALPDHRSPPSSYGPYAPCSEVGRVWARMDSEGAYGASGRDHRTTLPGPNPSRLLNTPRVAAAD